MLSGRILDRLLPPVFRSVGCLGMSRALFQKSFSSSRSSSLYSFEIVWPTDVNSRCEGEVIFSAPPVIPSEQEFCDSIRSFSCSRLDCRCKVYSLALVSISAEYKLWRMRSNLCWNVSIEWSSSICGALSTSVWFLFILVSSAEVCLAVTISFESSLELLISILYRGISFTFHALNSIFLRLTISTWASSIVS